MLVDFSYFRILDCYIAVYDCWVLLICHNCKVIFLNILDDIEVISSSMFILFVLFAVGILTFR